MMDLAAEGCWDLGTLGWIVRVLVKTVDWTTDTFESEDNICYRDSSPLLVLEECNAVPKDLHKLALT